MQRDCALDELLKSLGQETDILTRWLDASFFPKPSLTVTWPENMPTRVRTARQQVADIAKSLSRLAAGPDEHLHDLAWSPLSVSALRWVMHHGIPEAVNHQHGTSYADLAKACNVDQAYLERMVRFCTHDLIFHEPTPGHVAHTVASAALATQTGLRALVYISLQDLARASTQLIEAQEKWPGSEESTQSPWNIAYNTDAHVFDVRSRPNYDAWAQSFTDMMEYDNRQPLYDLSHVLRAYDWQGVDAVVDVGGGTGDLGLVLANAHSHLQVYVADREVTIATGKSRIPATMMPQLQFVACDFFSPLPGIISHAKTYLLRRILHDWPDKSAAKIVHNLLPVLKAGAKLLVMDMVLPEPGVLPEALDRTVRGLDLVMKHVLNGKERSQSEWAKLFADVDEKLVITSVVRPDGSALSLLVVELAIEQA